MKKVLVSVVLFSPAFFSITSCENKKSVFQVTEDTSLLDDSNYVYKNISTTKNLNFVDRKSKIDSSIFIKYSDSTCKKPLKLFSKNQCALLLAPFLPVGYGVDYAVDEMWGHFVSKQNKIGSLQPIIVSVGAVHDYFALRLIILNKNGKAISYIDLDDPTYFPQDHNSYTDYQTESYSVLDKNEIISYRVSKFRYANKGPVGELVVDSVVFKSVIDAKGKISTKQIAKNRYTKKSKSVNK
ncbi:hypothetical protein [Mucilaginibacter dorajii]|nr:hypothetical protein [Mucilaginibacter dorajii]MCS3737354.1 hypothetical protein [Mucilaginibacter dorajii]